jgi:hypothetical protein
MLRDHLFGLVEACDKILLYIAKYFVYLLTCVSNVGEKLDAHVLDLLCVLLHSDAEGFVEAAVSQVLREFFKRHYAIHMCRV